MGMRLLPSLPKKLKRALSYVTATKKRQRITGLVSILVFAAVGQIIISTFATTTEYSSIPAVAQMQKLTEEVVILTDEYAAMPDRVSSKGGSKVNPNKTKKKQELLVKVKARKEAYKQAIQYDPQTTANHYLPEDTRTKLPAEAKADLERFVETGGVWVNAFVESSHSEKEPTNKGRTQINHNFVYVETANNQSIYLYAKELPLIKTGSPVKIKGVLIDDFLVPAQPSSAPSDSKIVLFPKAEAIYVPVIDDIIDDAKNDYDNIVDNLIFCKDRNTCVGRGDVTLVGEQGKRKTLVIPVNFKEGENTDLETNYISNAYYLAASTFEQMSYGKFKPEYEVLPYWLTADHDNKFDCREEKYGESTALVRKITHKAINSYQNGALKNKIQEGGYTDLMYVYNKLGCENPDLGFPAGGWADRGGNRGEGYLGESSVIFSSGETEAVNVERVAGVIVHELGHSFGLAHAGGACNEGAPTEDDEELDLSKFCTSDAAEYADVYNFMGNSRKHIAGDDGKTYNFANKARLGWVDPNEDLIELTGEQEESSTHTINAIYEPTGKRAIKLSQGGKEYFIEHRPKKVPDLSTGLIVYFEEDSMTRLLGGNYQPEGQDRDGATITAKWSYDEAAKLEPFRIGEGESSICVTPSNATLFSVTVKIEKNCQNITEIAPVSSVGGTDSTGKSLPGVTATDKNVTQFTSNSSTCYDHLKGLWFVGDGYRILVYDKDAITANRAKYVLGSDTINEYKTYRAGYSTSVRPKTFYFDAVYETKTAVPDNAIDSPTQWLHCGNGKLYAGLSNGDAREGKIKIFDYTGGVQNGMNPVAVLGQAKMSENLAYVPPTAGSMGGRSFSAYASAQNILFVADYQNGRVLGFDMSKGASNNMPAKYVLGQKDFVSKDSTSVDTFRPSSIVVANDELIVSAAYRTSATRVDNNKILRYKLQDIVDGKKEPYASFGTPNISVNGETRGVGYDLLDNRILVIKRNSIYAYNATSSDPNKPDLLATYIVDYNNAYKEIYWVDYDSNSRRLYANARDGASFGRNHRNIFIVPPRDKEAYTPLKN